MNLKQQHSFSFIHTSTVHVCIYTGTYLTKMSKMFIMNHTFKESKRLRMGKKLIIEMINSLCLL